MLKQKTIYSNVSKKIISENLLQQICIRNNEFVLNEIQAMENSLLILMPLVENGYIEYDTDRPGYDWDKSNRTIPHHLNILQFLIDNKSYSNVLDAIFANDKIKADLEQNNLDIYQERIEWSNQGKGYPPPKNHFVFKNLLETVFNSKSTLNDTHHVFKVIKDNYSVDDIVLHLAGPLMHRDSDLKKWKAEIKKKISEFSYVELNGELPTNPSQNKKQPKV
jgi:hypothetical protein